jgi:hypothetical protein
MITNVSSVEVSLFKNQKMAPSFVHALTNMDEWDYFILGSYEYYLKRMEYKTRIW